MTSALRRRWHGLPARGTINHGQDAHATSDVVIERDSEGCYVASVPELRGFHTQAKSLDTLMKRVREAIELTVEVEGSHSPKGGFPA
jgi:predicted RNase H-like HicB family nuclease